MSIVPFIGDKFMGNHIPRDMLVEFHLAKADMDYGSGSVTKTDLRKVPYRKLLGSWYACTRGDDRSAILIKIVGQKKQKKSDRTKLRNSARLVPQDEQVRFDWKLRQANDDSFL